MSLNGHALFSSNTFFLFLISLISHCNMIFVSCRYGKDCMVALMSVEDELLFVHLGSTQMVHVRVRHS